MTGRMVQARAYAKINLALSVGPPLPSAAGAHAGYHPICSWFAPIALWEDLEIEALPAGEPSRYEITWADDAPRPSPIDWPLEKDLAVRAHRLLEARAGKSLPLAMRLRKRVPVGGGLGGGSSDAAAMLRGVNLLFGLGRDGAELAELSRKLGSDVAFFLDGELGGPPRPAIVSGLGERIERVKHVPGRVVLIVPPFGCPTGPVYRAFDGSSPRALDEQRVRELVARSVAAAAVEGAALFNDLTAAAQSVAPGLADLARLAPSAPGARVHLTGSGSTLFVLDADVSLPAGVPGVIVHSHLC